MYMENNKNRNEVPIISMHNMHCILLSVFSFISSFQLQLKMDENTFFPPEYLYPVGAFEAASCRLS